MRDDLRPAWVSHDIGGRETKRSLGEALVRFIASCRLISVGDGSNVFDFDGSIETGIRAACGVAVGTCAAWRSSAPYTIRPRANMTPTDLAAAVRGGGPGARRCPVHAVSIRSDRTQ